ncbi:MAG: Resolvase helix-turn-helix domain protein [Frankiales bacterium]|nr:Resolvase helix-turn-helix domain protein [Frankiales bacterium]
MGRHRTTQEKQELGEQARRLRAEGWSRERLRCELRVGDELLTQLLAGTVVPDRLRRPRARDDARTRAEELRGQGWTYDEIARELGVAKSSCSLWLRHLPRPEPVPSEPDLVVDRPEGAAERRALARRLREQGASLRVVGKALGVSTTTASAWCRDIVPPVVSPRGGSAEHVRAMAESRWAPLRAARDQRRALVHEQAGVELGSVTPRDLLIALAVSYWCEGAKSKPWRPVERVVWMNSDPGLVTLFLRGLEEAGVDRQRISFRLSIHEAADEAAARAWWARHVGVDPEAFARTTVKRHNPVTTRHRTDGTYRGCLTVSVRQSRELYQYLDGLVRALVGACEAEGGGDPALVS